uniref:Peptidase S1 domain-containing protein n=1 Tax=Anopheles minimus TaxID=112268 RepID=A0A182WKH1_9DIPT
MHFYTAVFVIGVAVVAAGASDVQPMPQLEMLLNVTQEIRPLVEPSNNISTDGYNVFPGQFPHHAQLYIKNINPNGATVTAGSLITPNYILTRANALRESITMYNFTYGYAILGTDGKMLLNVTQELRPLVDPSNNISTDGYNVYGGQFPHHAQLYIKNINPNGATVTAGSLITPNYILTEADGLRSSISRYNFTYGYAILGTDGSSAETRQQINFQQCGVQLHPIHNIATVRLDLPATLNKFVQPIRLPALSDIRTYELMEGTNVGSWGRKYLRNQVMVNDDCHEQHPYANIYPYNICTNTYVGGAFCYRRYGSGLIVEDDKGPILVGITTLIYWCEVNYPTVYLRVSEFRDWISMNSNYLYTVFVVIGVVVVATVASEMQPLQTKVIGILKQELQPLADASNNLSTYGYVAYPGQFPYHVRLSIKNGVDTSTTLSAGSLITPNYILTQARDLRSNINYANMHGYAVLGIDYDSSTEREQQINFTKSSVQLHPTYDIGTVRMDHPATFNKFVQPIRLPTLSDSRTYELMEGTNVGSFFGLSSYVRNQVLANVDCSKQMPTGSIYSYNICTNTYVGGAFCNGVYGSGLVVEDENGPILVGVSTLMYTCAVNHPTIYLRVTGLQDWISANSDYVYDL